MINTRKIADTPRLNTYTMGEDIVNSITHAVGLGLSLAGAAILISLSLLHGDAWFTVSFGIYGSSLIILYMASTLYHAFRDPAIKKVFKIVDHASIYLLIAGSYTPFLLIDLRNVWGWSLLCVIWGLALLGILYKIFFIQRLRKLSVFMYVFMGWLCVIVIREILDSVPATSIILMIIGGVVYTSGVIFYAWRRLPYNHAIWHLFVMGGSICHYFSILLLLPKL